MNIVYPVIEFKNYFRKMKTFDAVAILLVILIIKQSIHCDGSILKKKNIHVLQKMNESRCLKLSLLCHVKEDKGWRIT